MSTRKNIIKVLSFTALVTGAVLLGVGSAGTATPLILTGILLILVSGAGGFMAALEPSSVPFMSRSATTTASASTA